MKYIVSHNFECLGGAFKYDPREFSSKKEAKNYIGRLLRRQGEPETMISKNLSNFDRAKSDWKYEKTFKTTHYKVEVKCNGD